jgi:hypothetical protein
VKITGWKKWLLILLFLSGFGFAGGGSFLLFALVPLEANLEARGWTQTEIDHTLRLFVYGWFVFSFLVTYLYARLTLSKGRLRMAAAIALVLVAAAGFVFYEFLHTRSSFVAGSQSRIEVVSEQLSFGPYPDESTLIELKSHHYDGVITLLHPAIPFEKILMDEEKKNGEKVGLAVYSFPMLPWVTDNKQALNSIWTLLQQPGKRWYVHCYLGQHRTNLVRQLAGFGVRPDLAYAENRLATTLLDNRSPVGVTGDGSPSYVDGQEGVKSYFGVFGKDVNLLTYDTARKLHFTFDPSSSAFRASGIGPLGGADLMGTTTLYGLNFWGRYRDMGSGTTAQVRLELEFYVNGAFYQLQYDSLAVYRKGANTWLLTSDPADIPGNPGFLASPAAQLGAVKNRVVSGFGTVNMPIRFEVTLR